MGLDIEDVDFKNNGIKVTRKGGNEMVVYFGSEVEKALKNYLEVRENIVPLSGHEHALFYSSQKKRIGVQAIENLKKYSREITTTKDHLIAQDLRYGSLSGNRRYLPCSGRSGPQGCKYNQKALCGLRRCQTAS